MCEGTEMDRSREGDRRRCFWAGNRKVVLHLMRPDTSPKQHPTRKQNTKTSWHINTGPTWRKRRFLESNKRRCEWRSNIIFLNRKAQYHEDVHYLLSNIYILNNSNQNPTRFVLELKLLWNTICVKNQQVDLYAIFTQSAMKTYYKADVIKICSTSTRLARMIEQNRIIVQQKPFDNGPGYSNKGTKISESQSIMKAKFLIWN